MTSELSEIVSSDLDELILVNSDDIQIGKREKKVCHLKQGELHRAFSIFIFNTQGEVLLQQRSEQKFLWPMYWSNACCSHPRVGENSEDAARRRLEQELGISTELTYLYKFEYHAEYNSIGSEHELCWVWVGVAEAKNISPNSNEIANLKFLSKKDLDQELLHNPKIYTPWMKMEWQRIFEDHNDTLKKIMKD